MAKTTKKNSQEVAEQTENHPELFPPAETPELSPEVEAQSETETPPDATAATGPDFSPDPPPEIPRKKGPGRYTEKEENQRPNILDRLQCIDWEGVYAYVYRQRPVTNALLNGQRHTNVKRYDTKFDFQDLMEEAGSGAYLIKATRLDPKTGARPCFDQGEIRIMNMNHPPRLPPGIWVDDPANKEWLWAKDLIMGKKPEAAPAAPPAPVTDPLVDILRDQIKAQREEMAAIRAEAREQSNKKDPSEQTLVSVLAPFVPAIIEKMTAAPPPPAPPPADPVRDMLMTYLMKQLENKQEANAPKDATSELEKTFELQKKMKTFFGGDEEGRTVRSRKTGWQEVLSDIGGPLAQMLTPLVQAIAMGAMQKAQQPQQQPPQQQQNAPQYSELPPPQTITDARPTAPTVGATPQKFKRPTLEAIASRFTEAIEQDEDGFSVGDWYLEQYGMAEFDEIRLQGKGKLMADLGTIPSVAAEMQKDARFEQLVNQFLTWEPGIEEEEAEPAPVNIASIQSGWNAPATDLQEVRP